MPKLSTTTTLLTSLLLTTATVTAAGTNCTTFNWDNQPPNLTTYPPQRISGATSCPSTPSNLTCALSASGDAQYAATANITALNTETFIPVVSETVSNSSSTLPAPGFNASVIGAIDTTRILRPGQAAYLNFTAYRFCFTGSVGDCGDGVGDGDRVEICAPVWHEEGEDARLDGEYEVVNVREEDVGTFEDPYADQFDGGGDTPGEGGAVGWRGNGGLAVLAGLVVVLVV